MRQKLSSVALVFSLVSIGYSQQVRAYEIASDNAELVNAGAEARAQGPSTIASNPAGLSYLVGTQVSMGAQLSYGRVKFEPDSSTNVSGGGSGNAIEPALGGSFFISSMLDDDWSIGFGSYAGFGSELDYKSSWAGRYFIQSKSSSGFSLVPSVAYRINEQWSIGAGIKATYGSLKYQAATDQSPVDRANLLEGQLKYKGSTWGYGVNLGVIYELQPGTRIGLAYTSKVNLNFSDHLNMQGTGVLLAQLNGKNIKFLVQTPQTATLSLYQQIDPKLAVLATLGWQDTSQVGSVAVDIDTSRFGAQSIITKTHYNDTYQLALDAQYKVIPELLWSAGVAYGSSAISNNNRTFTNPIGSQWCLGTGATYALNHETDLNLSWDAIWMGDLPVDQTQALTGNRTSGVYKNTWFQVITGNLTWRF
jgi:long-chain fatty acid transport protein